LFNYNPGKFILEEFMDGPEVSVEGYVTENSIHLIAIIDKLPMKEPYFIEVGENIPSRHPRKIQEEIYDVTRHALKALGYRSCGVHAEIKLTKEGPKIVEVAARLGGDYICNLVESVYGVDLVDAVFECVQGRHPVVAKKMRCHMVGRCLIPKHTGRFKGISGIDKINKLNNLYDLKIHFNENDLVYCPPDGFDYVGWIIGKGNSVKEVNNFAQKALSIMKVKVE
jgi:biotin carboxylase